MTEMIKPRVIVHATGAPFVETYIDSEGMMLSQHFAGTGVTEDELFHMVARFTVGKGLPYWEVDWGVINSAYDPATRDAWVIDPEALGEPSGYGEREYV